MLRGRLAPSPTGFLHLGNAWAFLLAWLGVRVANGALVLRLEDLDPQRSKPEFTAALLEDLRWLGLDWDEGPSWTGEAGGTGGTGEAGETGEAGGGTGTSRNSAGIGPYRQSERLQLYAQAVEKLLRKGLAYPCYCTRQELRSLAGAPQAGDEHEAPYPGTCRNLSPQERAAKDAALKAAGRRPAIRLAFPPRLAEQALRFNDLALGPQMLDAARYAADFAIRRSDGVFAYQLAVSLDDMAMGITQVIRGADILQSTPRQRLFFLLNPPGESGGACLPEYGHIPLLLDHKGERLAKRHAALALRELRQTGVTPQAVTGYLAFLGGLQEKARPLGAAELCARYAANADKNLVFKLLPQNMPPLPEDVVGTLRSLRA